jgi:twitching motility protein PilT
MPFALQDIIRAAEKNGASDIHLVYGLPPRCRIDGEITDMCEERLMSADCENYAKEIVGKDYSDIENIGEWDGAKTYGNVRCRINVFRQQGSVSAAIRILHSHIPSLDELALPKAVGTLPALQSGIVLVTGVTGSGKSTTLAALLDTINHTKHAHIITLEDPIEYVYKPDLCVINQREIGRDTKTYSDGLRAILREDPDVILIGEMRDLDTIRTALTAAETGHLVFTTLHTGTAAEAIDRMVEVFPEGEQRQIRMQVSTTLQAVLSQKLLPKKTGGGRIAACEIMIVTAAVRNLIREGKTPQIANVLATSASVGSITLDNSIIKLYRERKISKDTAQLAARDKEYVKRNTGM